MYRRTNKPNEQELAVLLADKSNHEVAGILDVDVTTIVRWRREAGLSHHVVKCGTQSELSSQQYDLITGSLLGDGMVEKQGRFRIRLNRNFRKYLEYISELLRPFSNRILDESHIKPVRINETVVHGISDQLAYSSLFYTRVHSIFKDLRTKWYPEGKKVVPKDVRLNDVILAHWFIQDGTNAWYKKNANIATCGFTGAEVDFLRDQLSEMGIPTTRQRSKNLINIGARHYFDFMDRIRPHVTVRCFDYKVDTSKAPITKPGYGAGKLTKKQVEEIRRLHATGKYTQQGLADIYGVTQSLIGLIVNRVIHRTAAVSFGGTATYQYAD